VVADHATVHQATGIVARLVRFTNGDGDIDNE
jgi:hypothetical protein